MKSAAECYKEAQETVQETYIAFYFSQERELSTVLSSVLDPFGKFGEFLTELIPVKNVKVALRQYLKLRESIFAQIYIQFLV